MKRLLKNLLLIVLFVSVGQQGFCSPHELFFCRDPELGVRFMCNPRWQVVFDDQADMFIISEDPVVIMTIVREPTRRISLFELTPERLKNLGQYAEGFQREPIVVGGMSAVKVKAFDRNFSDIRITDIYMLKNGNLFKILFSVTPRKEWDTYQFLFEEILEGFSLLE